MGKGMKGIVRKYNEWLENKILNKHPVVASIFVFVTYQIFFIMATLLLYQIFEFKALDPLYTLFLVVISLILGFVGIYAAINTYSSVKKLKINALGTAIFVVFAGIIIYYGLILYFDIHSEYFYWRVSYENYNYLNVICKPIQPGDFIVGETVSCDFIPNSVALVNLSILDQTEKHNITYVKISYFNNKTSSNFSFYNFGERYLVLSGCVINETEEIKERDCFDTYPKKVQVLNISESDKNKIQKHALLLTFIGFALFTISGAIKNISSIVFGR